MPSFVRPNKNNSGSNLRPTPVTPMSERQQLALLMQMTGNESGSRSPSSQNANATRARDRNERGETSLHLAAIKGDVEQVSKLLAHRADPNVADFADWTPLHEACNHGWYEVAFRLVQAGANVNAKGLDNETPLHDAAINGHMKLIKLLVERGADIHAKNSKGKTPLDVASPSIAEFLLNPNLPVAETSASARLQPRSRDEKKVTTIETKKEEMETKAPSTDDVYEFKASKESVEKSPPEKAEAQEQVAEESTEQTASPTEQDAKRNFSEISDNNEEASANDEESRRKKRKDSDAKDVKSSSTGVRSSTSTTKGQNVKASTSMSKTTGSVTTKDRKSPVDSPKPASDAEMEDGKTDLKVPPLKIVIPQSTQSEQESGQTRNGKNNSQRSHAALPYVVPSSTEGEKETNSGNNSPTESLTSKEDKKDSAGSNGEEKSHHQRVLRSSHRSGQTDRSNNSSPQLQRSHSPSPSASPAAPTTEIPAVTTQGTTSGTNKSSDSQASNNSDTEPSTSSNNSNSGNNNSSAPVELHPRKRKMKPSKETTAPQATDALETPAVSEVHPHEQPITNCYQLYQNIRKQIDKRRKGLFPVQPKPPQGFKDYLMNRCTYVLAGRAPTTPNITYPATLVAPMKDIFSDQEKERYKLRMQHVIEKEKLVLSVEQEILRVHGRAARALANQSLPFSVCTILRDEEVYNLITPEQEEKDRNARSRYNGRLFLSWLQDVDDKWEKIKEHMLLRHHNEAESLYAVQKMDWEWKMKELNLCDAKTTPNIDDMHVPMVHVSDDFDLLPA